MMINKQKEANFTASVEEMDAGLFHKKYLKCWRKSPWG